MQKSVILTLGLLSPVLAQTKTDFTIGAKALILTAGHSSTYDLPKWVLESYGVDYDIKELTTSSNITLPFNNTQATNYTITTQSLDLVDSDTNQPKYNAIILTSVKLGFHYYTSDFARVYFPKGLTTELDAELDAYCTDYGVRTVSLATNPIELGDAALNNVGGVSHKGSAKARFIENELSASMHNVLKLDADYLLGGETALLSKEAYWLTPAEINQTENADGHVQELMEVIYECSDGSTCKHTGVSLITNLETNRETLHFHFNMDAFGLHGFTFGHLWFPWISKGLFLGHRQVIFQADIDDYYLDTGVYNTTLMRQATDNETLPPLTERINGDDLEHHKLFQDRVNHQIGGGSNFTIQMAFNGRGKGIFSDVEAYAPNLNPATLEKFDDFLWVTHTWNHIDLYCLYSNCTAPETRPPAQEFDTCFDWTSQTCEYGAADEPIYPVSGFTPYEYAMYELTRNQHFANTVLNVNDHAQVWSPNSIVTPRISGLNYTESVRAMLAAGIRNAVGDNSRDDLRPENPWQPFESTVKMGADGQVLTAEEREAFESEMMGLYGVKSINVVPRFATRVYFDVATPEQMAAEHNSIYGPKCILCQEGDFRYDHDLSSQEIIEIEGFETARNLLSLRTDPYMFHQVNLRVNDMGAGRTASLLEDWVDAALKWVTEYTSFPVQSYKLDDLAEVYRLRKERDDCEISGKIQYVGGKPVKLTVASKNACQAKLTYTNTAGSADYAPLVQTHARVVRRQADNTNENVDTTIDLGMEGNENTQDIDLGGSGMPTPSPLPSTTPSASPVAMTTPETPTSPTQFSTTTSSSGSAAPTTITPTTTVTLSSESSTELSSSTSDTITPTSTTTEPTITPTPTPTPTPSTSPAATGEVPSGNTGDGADSGFLGLSTAALIGICVGIAGLILAVLMIGICLCRREARTDRKLLGSSSVSTTV